MNYYKQQQRRNRIVTNYERSLGHAKGAPLFVRTLGDASAYRPVTEFSTVVTKKFGRISVSSTDVNAPRRKVLKNGKRRIVFK